MFVLFPPTLLGSRSSQLEIRIIAPLSCLSLDIVYIYRSLPKLLFHYNKAVSVRICWCLNHVLPYFASIYTENLLNFSFKLAARGQEIFTCDISWAG